MLSPEAKIYFNSLLRKASADAWIDLDKIQKNFEHQEFSHGRSPASEGYSVRLTALYSECLSHHARDIVNALKTVHTSFQSPLNETIDDQLLDWGTLALGSSYQGLRSAYARHLGRFGVHNDDVPGLRHTYTLTQATVANLLRDYLWELRNVPSKRPVQSATSSQIQLTINNNGLIGSIQTGTKSTAYVQQQWTQKDKTDLDEALAALKNDLIRANDIESDIRNQLIADIESASSELQKEKPNEENLLSWLKGIEAVIGTVGSVQPAYEAVKSLAQLLGFSF